MINRIKKTIDRKLAAFIDQANKQYGLSRLSPILFKVIRDFVVRDGKRIRPILFVLSYGGFAKKQAKNLYPSALAIELLHDFMLVHDDIIDKSDIRRGKPSMHAMLNTYLQRYPRLKFNGQDLSIVVGDVMYAMAIDAFLAIDEKPQRKETALRAFIEAALYTGSGEFIELINGVKSIKDTTKRDIYNVYDYKTARYTFATPLATGAILAGAHKGEVTKLFRYGIALGRAFQIKDDLLGIFGDEKKIGKSVISDLQEAKKTLLIWHAYNNAAPNGKRLIEEVFSKRRVIRKDLTAIQRLMRETNTLSYVHKETTRLLKQATTILASSRIKTQFKKSLTDYAQKILVM